MNLTIISPEKQYYDQEVSLVQFPGAEGSFAVLPGHTCMIASLAAGDIRIVQPDKQTVMVAIKGGIVEIKDDKLLVLAL